MREENDSFGKMIRAALRDEAAQCRLPDDFTRRLMRGVHAQDEADAPRFPLWVKVAASLAAMASFAAFAAWVGVTVYEAAKEEEGLAEAVPVDPETEMISSQKGGNTMIARKMATLVGAAMVSVAVPAAELTSEPTFVFLRPETSSFWNTATNSTMTVPIDFPAGASSASLTVTGLGYNCIYPNIVSEEFTFDLPAPTSPEAENVYDLTLVFDNNVTNTARLGLIQGLSPDAEGTTRCLAPQTAKVWQKVKGRAVLPIPYGTTSFTVNGVETDTGLDGAQGWYAIGGLDCGQDASLGLVANGVQYAASLIGGPGGLMLIVR